MATRKSNHAHYVVLVEVEDTVDVPEKYRTEVFQVTAANDERAKEEGLANFKEKHQVLLSSDDIKTLRVVDRTVNEMRSRRYYEGYRRGLGRPVEIIP